VGTLLDHWGPWTVDDVLALREHPHGHRYELLDGSLLVTPGPGVRHQRASFNLHTALASAAARAAAEVEVFGAVAVRVPSGLLVPDLVVVKACAVADDPPYVDAAAVVLVVEVVSPDRRRWDLGIKPGLYAEAGIARYWRVEVEPAPAVVAGVLTETGYVDTTVSPGTTATVDEPFPITLDPAVLIRR